MSALNIDSTPLAKPISVADPKVSVTDGMKDSDESSASSIFYSSYDDSKDGNISTKNDATTKQFVDNGCSLQNDSSLAKNIQSKIKESVADLYAKATKAFQSFNYSTSENNPDTGVKSNLDSQVAGFNSTAKTDYNVIIQNAKAAAEAELKQQQSILDSTSSIDKKGVDNINKNENKISVTNSNNKKGTINGKAEVNYDSTGGNIDNITVTSDRTQNKFVYKRDKDSGEYVQTDKDGNPVKDKSGDTKKYTLSEDGQLVRLSSKMTIKGQTYVRNNNAGNENEYQKDGNNYLYDGQNMTQMLAETNVVEPKGPQMLQPKIQGLKADGNVEIPKHLPGINTQPPVNSNVAEVKKNDTPQVGQNINTPKQANKVASGQDNLTQGNIDGNIAQLKPGESYKYQQVSSQNWGTGSSTITSTITWTRNQDGSLTESHLSGSSNSPENLKSTYSADKKHKLSQQFVNNMGGASVVSTSNYDESGKKLNTQTDLSQYDTSKTPGALPKLGFINNIMQHSNSSSSEIKNSEGKTILQYKDGQYFDNNGKVVDKNQAMKILQKADKKGEIASLVQDSSANS